MQWGGGETHAPTAWAPADLLLVICWHLFAGRLTILSLLHIESLKSWVGPLGVNPCVQTIDTHLSRSQWSTHRITGTIHNTVVVKTTENTVYSLQSFFPLDAYFTGFYHCRQSGNRWNEKSRRVMYSRGKW